jgi:serine/threonine protein kinase
VAFFSMELLEGPDLVAWLRRNGRVDSAELVEGGAQRAGALYALHRAGRLHRDLKPANILIAGDGRCVVLDFGLIETGPRDAYASHRTDQIIGTLAYMAPEALEGRQVTAAVDWYAMGALLFEAITGAPPSKVLGTSSVVPRLSAGEASVLPAELIEAVEASLQPDPEQRLGFDGWRRAVGRPAHPAWSRADAAWLDDRSLFGREAEIERLISACLPIERGARVVRVSGESGVGKTRLLDYFLEGLRGDGYVVLQSRCRPSENVAYQALDGAIDGLARLMMSLSHEQLRTLLPRRRAALSRIFPVLRRVPELGAADDGESGLEPHELRRSAVSALRELVGRIGGERRTLMWIDDAQWGDDASAAVITALLEAPGPDVTLIVSARTDLSHRSSFLARLAAAVENERVEEIEIGPLDAAAVRRMCANHLVDLAAESRETVTRVVIAEAGGNPVLRRSNVRADYERIAAARARTSATRLRLDGEEHRDPAGGVASPARSSVAGRSTVRAEAVPRLAPSAYRGRRAHPVAARALGARGSGGRLGCVRALSRPYS